MMWFKRFCVDKKSLPTNLLIKIIKRPINELRID